MTSKDIENGIERALAEVDLALQSGETPVGCALVDSDGSILASAHNTTESDGDVLSHAEMNALQTALSLPDRKRLTGVSLIVTLEPCLMCLGACIKAGIESVYYMVSSPDSGAFTRYGIQSEIEEHRIPDRGQCQVLSRFFSSLRKD